MIANHAAPLVERPFRFESPAGELLPEVEVVVLGRHVDALARMVDARRAAWHRSYEGADSRPLPYSRETVAPYQVMYLMLDQCDADAVARATERVAAAREASVTLIALAALGKSLSHAADVVSKCDCALISEHPAGLLHLLRLLLPPPQQVIGYDLADVMTIWRGGFGRVSLLSASDDPPPGLADLATNAPHPRGVTMLLEEQDVVPERLRQFERHVDRVRAAVGGQADLLWAFNRMPPPRDGVETALVWSAADVLTHGERS